MQNPFKTRRVLKQLAMVTGLAALVACSEAPTVPTPPPNANITGSYDLTITASPSCAANLPADTRVMKFIANVTQTGATFNVSLLAHVIFNSATVTGTVSGQSLTFSAFSFSENTTAGGIALASTGSATVAATGAISGTFNGTYQTPAGATCTAANHQMQMVKP